MREIDGSKGEGGGQILRTSLALSALTADPVRVRRIRAGRPKPGLAPQHLAAARALSDLCGADVEGLALGSQEVVFRPGPVDGGRLRVDVGTAGSVTLVLQCLLLPALRAGGPTALRITGGTDVKWSPPADYAREVFLPLLHHLGASVDLRVPRRGYYPRGGGRVEVDVTPVEAFRPFQPGTAAPPGRVRGRAHVGNLPGDIAKRMKRSALKGLAAYPDVRVEDTTYGPDEAEGRGGALVLWAETGRTRLGASALAKRGVPAEELGRRASSALARDLEARTTLDVHAADQLLPYMALAEGPSSFLVREVSGHVRALLWLLPHFLPVTFREEVANGLTRIDVIPSRT